MSASSTIINIVNQITANFSTEREKAIGLHNCVRENVKFGFNKYFDAAPPDYVLSCGQGHCNPKSRLMVALFQAAGFESHQHFVVIPKDILKGAIPPSRFWMIAAEVSHSYAEVKVEGKWCNIDSYIVDTALLKGGKARLAQENRQLGYGVRADSINTWDGRSDAFSQYDKKLLLEDHGRIDDLDAYFKGKRYRNTVLGMPFNTIFRLMGEFNVTPMNVFIDKIRQ